jgi:beta-mannosidase
VTRRSVALADGWSVKSYLSTDAAVAAAEHAWDGEGWLAARVPGSVAHDVWQAGEAPSPYHERDSLALEWVAERAWRYRSVVAVPSLADGEVSWLRFEGVDHAATVLWDGVVIADHEGMFVPFEVALPGVAPGGHRLDVVVAPAPGSEPQVGRTSRVRIHKSRMSYGWDFCPRLVHQGIWRPVTLEMGGPARLLDVWARPSWAGEPGGDARLEVRAGVEAAGAAGRLALTLRDGRRIVAATTAEVGSGEVDVTIEVPAPRAWRVNGTGEPVVHRLTVELLAPEGTVLDTLVVPVGFRSARLVANEGAPAGARAYTLEIDGRRRPITGWNWTPPDLFHGVPRPAHLEHLIRLARDAHVNVLRVWGGGLIEDDAFYDACDHAGILVWQEFSQSSSGIESVPSTDRAFVERMATEARAIVPLRRNHPSLLLWGGGNELADERPLDEERSPVLAALRDVVAELDPDRAWLPTSPSGPAFHNRLDEIRRDPDGQWDVHGPWEHQGLIDHNALYDAGTSLLASEFGVEGMTNRRLHESLIDPAHRWPATRSSAVYRHLGDWWINEPLVQAAFGGGIDDLESLRRASQHLQADGLRYAVEANRRRWPRSAGTLPWQFDEAFPNAWCTTAVDHRGDPKPVYHGVASAYRPVHVCARFARWAWAGAGPFRAEAWAWSIDGPHGSLRVDAAVASLDGASLVAEGSWPVGLPDDRPRCAGVLEVALPEAVALLDLRLVDDEAVLATNRYLVSGTADLAPLRSLPGADVDVAVEGTGDTWHITLAHRGGPAAVGLVVDDDRPVEAPGWAEADDGWFVLLPGETHEVRVRWADAPADGRRLRVHGWNVDVVVD